MKTASAGFQTHLNSNDLRLAYLWKLTRADGFILRLSEHDVTLTVSGDGDYVSPGSGEHSQIRSTDKMRGEGLDINILFDSSAVTENDVRAGKWNDALVELQIINWSTPGNGVVQIKRLRIGQMTWGEGEAKGELHDLPSYLERTVGQVMTADCLAELGSTTAPYACYVDINAATWQATTVYAAIDTRDANVGDIVKSTNPSHRVWFKCTTAGTSGGSEPTWDTTPGNTTNDNTVVWTAFRARRLSGTVTGVTDKRNFADTSLVEPDAYWDWGKITWTTGNNAGTTSEVLTYLSSGGAVKLKIETRLAIQVGDQYTIIMGCSKSATACQAFENIENYRGYGKFLPGNEAIFRTPDAN